MLYFSLLVSLILFLCYKWVNKRYSFFKDRGITQIEPKFPYGNIATLGKTESIGQLTRNLYDDLKKKSKPKTPIAGFYSLIFPTYLVIDVDILKNILVSDFNNFTNRGHYENKKDDPLTMHLLTMKNDEWKTMRKKMSPTFSAGKLKVMAAIMVDIAEELVKCVENATVTSNEIEMRDILDRFTIDVIGSCAYGIESNSLKNKIELFHQMGCAVFIPENQISTLKHTFTRTFPKLSRKLGITILDKTISKFFIDIVKNNVEYKKENNVQRNDILKSMMDVGGDNHDDSLTINDMAAQLFDYFVAGFGTTTAATSFALYELAANQLIQDKAREEVKTVLTKYNNKITYECLMEMKYIEMIIDESLRKYPPSPTFTRQANENYRIENTDIVIQKDIDIIISIYGIHHDPELYPNPEIFDPERFTDEAKRERHPYAYIPFGKGPRSCIGPRFGMMQSRIALACLLNNFKFTLNHKTIQPPQLDPQSDLITSIGGLHLSVEKI